MPLLPGELGLAPGHARGGIIKIDFAARAALGHLLHNDHAKPAPLRWTAAADCAPFSSL
jgi:hypothetical protein